MRVGFAWDGELEPFAVVMWSGTSETLPKVGDTFLLDVIRSTGVLDRIKVVVMDYAWHLFVDHLDDLNPPQFTLHIRIAKAPT